MSHDQTKRIIDELRARNARLEAENERLTKVANNFVNRFHAQMTDDEKHAYQGDGFINDYD